MVMSEAVNGVALARSALLRAAAAATPASRVAVSALVSPAAPRTSFFTLTVAFSMFEAPSVRR